MYTLDGHTLDLLGETGQRVLADIHRDPARRPGCACNPSEDGGVPMYVARIGDRYYLKRMPGTGPEHAPGCGSWSPPAELSGLAPLLGSAIHQDPEGGTTGLDLGFALTRNPARAAAGARGDRTDTDEGTGASSRLSLRGVLHYLWDEAGLTRWTPALSGKRHWGMIRARLLQAADSAVAKGRPLTDYLYIPETFSSTRKPEIAGRRTIALHRLSSSARSRRLMLVIGEVKDIRAARFEQHVVIVKHLPDFPILIDGDLHTQMRARFATELALRQAIADSHLVLIGTFTLSPAGVAVADQVALMSLSADWIPFESISEHTLLEILAAQGRRYIKSLRYLTPAAASLASVVLSDTDPPTACYLTDTHQEEPADPGIPQWIWNISTDLRLPPLPPATGRLTTDRQHRPRVDRGVSPNHADGEGGCRETRH